MCAGQISLYSRRTPVWGKNSALGHSPTFIRGHYPAELCYLEPVGMRYYAQGPECWNSYIWAASACKWVPRAPAPLTPLSGVSSVASDIL
ncbi:hypothetical protein XELAEV_18018216mg [Xenopus laevis]|uniref:Uncharacterized protein n=1 Tax=Xenopus laevis TaxID=8355 RepID=A0A974HTL8_XENLA|nr:hypothetical protein XELAEV_18018216mg [Xenopus laevis]